MSSNFAVASMSNVAGSIGLATSLTTGTTTIVATLSDQRVHASP